MAATHPKSHYTLRTSLLILSGCVIVLCVVNMQDQGFPDSSAVLKYGLAVGAITFFAMIVGMVAVGLSILEGLPWMIVDGVTSILNIIGGIVC